MELKDDLTGKLVVIQQMAGGSDIAQKVLGEIQAVMKHLDDHDAEAISLVLQNLPKTSLNAVVESTGCGNLEHRVTVLSKAIFNESVDQVRSMESSFAKLTKCMKTVVELLLASKYYTEGSMSWKMYTKDVFEAK